MSTEHRRSIQWSFTWRLAFLVAVPFAGTFAASSCDDTGPSPIGVHPNDSGTGAPSSPPSSEGDAAPEGGADADARAEDASGEAGDHDAADAGEDADASS